LLHLQIGPSPLALGLLIPATLAAGIDVCVVGRAGDQSPREYVFSGSGPTGRATIHRVEWFEGPDEFGDLPEDLRRRIASREPLLITSTLRDRVAERRPLIEELLRARPPAAETILLACENAPDPIYREIAGACGHVGFRCLRTVVNRMCIGLPADSEGRRVVSAHPLGEWLIERPASSSELLGALEVVAEVEAVDDIDARQDRKLWMVNGGHQAVALMGRSAGVAELQISHSEEPQEGGRGQADDLHLAARDRDVLVRLSHLHGAMNTALLARHSGLGDSLDYGYKHVCAYGEHPDSINRVLGAMTRRELAPFTRTLELRLAEPARICFNENLPVRPFSFVFDVFEDLLNDLDAFIDADLIRRDHRLVTSEADTRALAAYSQLTTGWMSDDEARDRCRRFAKALAMSRPW
jgi:hypothetical protein